MGYIVQSIVFDKNKGWDMKTAREWVKNHKEFSKPIKEEETTNTIRVRLFPPKKAEQMGFKDYRMKTLASGDVGIMLDIAYNKLEGGADKDPIEELRRFNDRLKDVISGIKRNTNYMRRISTDPNFNLTDEERSQISNEIRLQEERIATIKRQINKNNDEIKYHQVGTGGSLAVEDLEALLAKSYSKNPEDYKDFQVDKELSGQRVQVYHNPTTQQTVVAHRGTSSIPNWIENVAYAVSNDKSGKAFQHSKKIQDQAYQKYGKENITTIGHSKGALHAQEYGKEGKEVITLNKPVNITDALFTRVPKSQTDIRTQYDPVSFLRPFQRGNKAETIKSTTKNPLAEHKTSVLGRLDPRKLFGSGIEDDKENLDPNIPQERHVINYRREEQRRAVQEAINHEIRNIYTQLRSERNDPRSLRTGLVPPFDLEQQIGVITEIAPQLRDTLVGRITGQRPVIDINNAVNYYRSALLRTLTTVLQEQQSGEEGEEKIGSGMMCPHCGVNCCCGMMRGGVIIRFGNVDVDFDTSSPLLFYNSIKAYYFSERPQRSGEYQEALQFAPNFVSQREQDIILDFQLNWDEFLDTLNGDNEMAKRRIIGVTELQIGGIIDNVLEYDEENIYTDNELELSSSDEEEEGGAIIDTSSPTDPIYVVLYLLGAMIGVPLTDRTIRYLYNLYQNNRQVIDDAVNDAVSDNSDNSDNSGTTETTESSSSSSDNDTIIGDEGAGRKKRKAKAKAKAKKGKN